MSQPCTFPVRLRTRGESKTSMLAKFADIVDAINFAHAKSHGQYNSPKLTLIVYNFDGKVFRKYREGELA